jgi:hypothetical protein
MAGFEYRGQLNGGDNPVVLAVKIANSSTVKVGDAVQAEAFASGGGCKRAAAGTEILGVCIAIVDANGIDLDNTSADKFDGTWTTASSTYAASADNMTDKAIAAKVIVDKNALWYNDAAGDLAAADELKYFDLDDQDQVADQNGADNAGALILVKRDPDGDGDASKGIFKIAESELDAYAQQ